MTDPLISLLIAALAVAVSLLVLWPGRGLYWRRAQKMSERVLIEDVLKHVYENDINGRCPTAHSVAEALQITVSESEALLGKARARELLQAQGEQACLTAQGRDYALQIIRAHRLWERYLAEESGFAEDEWHEQAHRLEHTLSPNELEALAARLGHPTHDPHGDPIPTADGQVMPHGGRPLTEMALDDLLRIVHLEDEPAPLYAQLVAEGLRPGMQVRLVESSPQRLRFWSASDEHVLAPVVAANISVVPLEQPQEPELAAPPSSERLDSLKPGGKARVHSISPASRGNERRRLMDLGILPGTLIEAEMTSPSGDPTAYLVRGALIALRHEQARLINITPVTEEALT